MSALIQHNAEQQRTRSDADIDALPYVDRDIDNPELKATVERLIDQEMRRMRRKTDGDRSNLPSEVELFEAHEELKSEWERTKRKEPLEALDTERYQMSAPKEKDPEAWQAAVDNSKAQLEAESNRLINLELLQKYGANAWRVHNYMLEAHLKRIQAANEDIKNKILQINRERKMDQTQAAGSLRSLEDKWSDLVSQNLQVDIACTALEQEVEELQRYKASLNQ